MSKLHIAPFVRAALVLAGLGVTAPAEAADQLLTGAIASATGQKLDGVVVSAKREGSTVTTSVYTDAAGNYYFPPMAAGKYQVWAQALGFEQTKVAVDLQATKHQDLTLKAIVDPETKWKQLPGELVLAALPESNAEDAHMKQIIHNNCTGCHTPSYPLQFRFDEVGWNRIIDIMKAPGQGLQRDTPANQVIQLNQKRLAAYLARVRGPNTPPPAIPTRPRPSGEAARAMWMLYDIPHIPGAGRAALPPSTADNDGTNWALGTPSRMGGLLRGGQTDLDGNVWFTSNSTNSVTTIGKIDAKTGEITNYKWPRTANPALASLANAITRDSNGTLWFDVTPSRRTIGKIDPKTGKITVYPLPDNIPALSQITSVDIDGKGMVWAASIAGAVKFDPKTSQFTMFRTTDVKRSFGNGSSFAAAGDRLGNGYWTEMAFDTIGKADVATGAIVEIKLPESKKGRDFLTPDEIAAYGKVTDISTASPLPWQQGPRGIAADKNADIIWTANSWGSSLARIDAKTNAVEMIATPDPAIQPFRVGVDSKHNVWGGVWTNDQIFKYDPGAKQWTMFEMPVRGTESRDLVVDEAGGQLKIVMPVFRTNQMAVMTIRSDADIAKLKQQAASR